MGIAQRHSPEEKLSGISVKQTLKNEQSLFCPVYVLDRRLQGGIGGIPKWNPWSRSGVYLGHSPEHSSDVALVLNLITDLVSLKYHVVFDATFSTLEALRNQKEPSNWENLCKQHAVGYQMNALPSEKSTATELQSEVLSWTQDTESMPASDEVDDIVVDKYQAMHEDVTMEFPSNEDDDIVT